MNQKTKSNNLHRKHICIGRKKKISSSHLCKINTPYFYKHKKMNKIIRMYDHSFIVSQDTIWSLNINALFLPLMQSITSTLTEQSFPQFLISLSLLSPLLLATMYSCQGQRSLSSLSSHWHLDYSRIKYLTLGD